MITRNLVHPTTRETFDACLSDAQRTSEQVRNATTPAEQVVATDYFISGDGLSGFALHENELVGVFSLVKGRGDKLIQEAIYYGATHLDCFDGYLPTFYAKHGFHETERVANWTAGGPDVVHMALPTAEA